MSFDLGNPTQGIYFVNPKGIDAFSVDSFTVANANTDQGKILGTRGGNAWAVAMDDNTELPLAIGWSVTATGVVQNGLVFSTDRQVGQRVFIAFALLTLVITGRLPGQLGLCSVN